MEDEYYRFRASSLLCRLATATQRNSRRGDDLYCAEAWQWVLQCSAAQGEARQRLGIIPSTPQSSSPIDATPGRISPCSPPSPPFILTSLAVFYLEILFWQNPRVHICNSWETGKPGGSHGNLPPGRDSKRIHRLGPIWQRSSVVPEVLPAHLKAADGRARQARNRESVSGGEQRSD